MMKNSVVSPILYCLGLMVILAPLHAQTTDAIRLAKAHLHENQQKWRLSPEDLQGLQVSDTYTSAHNGVTHVYFVQTYEGLEIFNTVTSLHLKDGKVLTVADRFIPDVASRVNASKPGVKPEKALINAAEDLGFNEKRSNLKLIKSEKNRSAEFEGGAISRNNIPSHLMYYPSAGGRLRLCWVMEIQDTRSSAQWMTFVDAHTGAVLEKINQTISCDFPGTNYSAHLISDECLEEAGLQRSSLAENKLDDELAPPPADGASYNVFAIPVESPIHGPRTLVSNPADIDASPFGWHDTNGVPGPEYTITRGNNVYAYLDQNADNRPDTIAIANGGVNLKFDYPLNLSLQPSKSRQAAITQLFYMNNIMHDFSYHYGFTESAGNFQVNNYGKGGRSNDPVNAEAQDGSDTNNANFATPSDGSSPRMQMFLWTASVGNAEITAPASIAGKYPVQIAAFGQRLTSTPLTGEIAVGIDGSASPNLGCGTLLNPASLKGKIVLIDRGTCTFEAKALNAQKAGAIACVACNFENTLPVAPLGDDPNTSGVTIPTVAMRSGDCELMKQALALGNVQLALVAPPIIGPDTIDASLDNGIIAHEYTHGISNRLTGGPSVSSCLISAEARGMGEGWSDFFALASTVVPGQNGKTGRGLGNYADYQGLNEKGIRRYAYSTDLKTNSEVYNDIIGNLYIEHYVGEVWAAMLWDLYWAMVDKYGWDPDLYRGKGGNNMAIQLVMDGLKLQKCNPGFIDARDAILAADAANYNGANECLIWEVFARRGLGWSADQVSSSDANDGLQAFDNRPECLKTLKVQKVVDNNINAGDTLNVTLLVYNHKDTPVSAAVLSDELPNGLSLIPVSVVGSNKTTVNNGVVTFEIGNLAPGTSKIIRYLAISNRNRPSIRQAFDDVEGSNGMWTKLSLQGQDTFRISTSKPYAGSKSWLVPDGRTEVDQALYLKTPIKISGTQPVLRFYQDYGIKPALEAGIIEVSTNGGNTWQYIPDSLVFRNGYPRPVDYYAFSIPLLRGFSGTTGQYVPTYVDLSKYTGQQIQVRFRFGSSTDQSGGPINQGWFIDNIEFMDLVNYDGQVCLSTAEGDKVCGKAASRGALVEPGTITTSTRDIQQSVQMRIYPNPSKDQINVQLEGLPAGRAQALLLSADGRVLQTQSMQNLQADRRLLAFDLSDLPAGLYLMQVKGEGVNKVEKVVKY